MIFENSFRECDCRGDLRKQNKNLQYRFFKKNIPFNKMEMKLVTGSMMFSTKLVFLRNEPTIQKYEN